MPSILPTKFLNINLLLGGHG